MRTTEDPSGVSTTGRRSRTRAHRPVLPMLSVPHLDREFDYRQRGAVQRRPARVRVRVRSPRPFRGRLVLERCPTPTTSASRAGSTAIPPNRCSPARCGGWVDAVAARYAGTRPDVLRLAVIIRRGTPARRKTSAARAAVAGCGAHRPPRVGPATRGPAFLDAPGGAVPPVRCGRRCPATAGVTGWPGGLPPPSAAGRACWPSSRTRRRRCCGRHPSHGSTPPRCSRWPPPRPSARYRRWLSVLRGEAAGHQNPQCGVHAPSTGSVWWWSGTAGMH